jgi:cyclophilin family peptidyl-prolyl cis-trans isomerase/FKBP-type peptidyl-prolyl cis-trans isomerase 2
MKIKLFTDLVPKTTTNFIGLATKWYYNDTIFHRVIKDFMIQWGDPEGTGRWGESIYGAKFDDEFHPDLKNVKYTLSMANAGPNTNGSQFFINWVDNVYLDNKHSVFWYVVEGTETVDKIIKVKTGPNDKPEKEVKIISIEIKEYQNGTFKDYNFDLDTALKQMEEIDAKKKEAKKIKAISAWDTISVHYTGTFPDGEKFDSSLDRWEPISFQVGAGQMIQWFDETVIGMKIGEKKSIELPPEKAYGWPELVIPKTQLQPFVDAGFKLEKWEKLPTQQWEIEILNTDEENVTVANNHPLAGKTLLFDIEIVDIQ